MTKYQAEREACKRLGIKVITRRNKLKVQGLADDLLDAYNHPVSLPSPEERAMAAWNAGQVITINKGWLISFKLPK